MNEHTKPDPEPDQGEENPTRPLASPTAPEAGWYPDPDELGDALRYWDGSAWTDHRSIPAGQAGGGGSAPPSPPTAVSQGQFRTTPVSDNERRNILAQQIQMSAVRGLRVESQDRYQAILIEGHPVNHVLHAILTVVTCGLWGIVWAVLAATGGEKRHLATVDEYGNVTTQNLGKS